MGYPQDLSNYWIPMLYVKLRNGSFTQVPQAYSDSKIYYQSALTQLLSKYPFTHVA